MPLSAPPWMHAWLQWSAMSYSNHTLFHDSNMYTCTLSPQFQETFIHVFMYCLSHFLMWHSRESGMHCHVMHSGIASRPASQPAREHCHVEVVYACTNDKCCWPGWPARGNVTFIDQCLWYVVACSYALLVNDGWSLVYDPPLLLLIRLTWFTVPVSKFPFNS